MDKFDSSSDTENKLDNLVSATSTDWQADPDFLSDRIFVDEKTRNLVESSGQAAGRASSLAQIPRFFEAIVTLIVCGLLLAVSLLIIKKAKAWCSNGHHNLNDECEDEEDEENPQTIYQNDNKLTPASCLSGSPSVTPPADESHVNNSPSTESCNKAQENQQHESNNSSDMKSEHGFKSMTTAKRRPSLENSQSAHKSTSVTDRKSQRQSQRVKPDGSRHHVSFARRSSDGPFGDDALAYAEETYHKVKDVNKEQKDDKFTNWARRFSSRRRQQPSENGGRSDIEIA